MKALYILFLWHVSLIIYQNQVTLESSNSNDDEMRPSFSVYQGIGGGGGMT